MWFVVVVAFPKATSVCKNLLSCHHRFSECRCDLSNVNKHVSHTFVSLFFSNFAVSFVSWDCVFIGIFMTLFCHVVQHHTSAVILELHLLSSSSACRTSLGFLHTPLLFFVLRILLFWCVFRFLKPSRVVWECVEAEDDSTRVSCVVWVGRWVVLCCLWSRMRAVPCRQLERARPLPCHSADNCWVQIYLSFNRAEKKKTQPHESQPLWLLSSFFLLLLLLISSSRCSPEYRFCILTFYWFHPLPLQRQSVFFYYYHVEKNGIRLTFFYVRWSPCIDFVVAKQCRRTSALTYTHYPWPRLLSVGHVFVSPLSLHSAKGGSNISTTTTSRLFTKCPSNVKRSCLNGAGDVDFFCWSSRHSCLAVRCLWSSSPPWVDCFAHSDDI